MPYEIQPIRTQKSRCIFHVTSADLSIITFDCQALYFYGMVSSCYATLSSNVLGNIPFVTCIFLVRTLAKNETPVFIGLISAALSCLIYVTSGSSPSSGWQSSVVCIPRKYQWLARYTILIKTEWLIMQFESFIGLEIVGYEPLKHTLDFFFIFHSFILVQSSIFQGRF